MTYNREYIVPRREREGGRGVYCTKERDVRGGLYIVEIVRRGRQGCIVLKWLGGEERGVYSLNG